MSMDLEFRAVYGDPDLEKWIEILQSPDAATTAQVLSDAGALCQAVPASQPEAAGHVEDDEPDEDTGEMSVEEMGRDESRYIDKQNAHDINRRLE